MNPAIIDDDKNSLEFFLELFADLKIDVRGFGSAEDFLDAYTQSPFECVVSDVRMPGMSGIELQKKLARDYPTLPVIIITGFADIRLAVDAVRNGAFDFIEKPVSHLLLRKRVFDAFSTSAFDKLINQKVRLIDNMMGKLTQREVVVLRYVLTGEKNKAIAHKLGISEKTVEVHRNNIKNKFHARSFVELAAHISFYRGAKMDRMEVLERVDLENDVLTAIRGCEPDDESTHCFSKIDEFIKSKNLVGDEIGVYEKIQVLIELEKITSDCPWADDNFCRAQLILSNIMG